MNRINLKQAVIKFIDGLIDHFVLDDGKLVVAHAGMKKELQGVTSASARHFALYATKLQVRLTNTDYLYVTTGAKDYHGEAMVVYGHTPVNEALWTNKTICVGHWLRIWWQTNCITLSGK